MPKQYLPLAGKKVIDHSISALLNCGFIDTVVVVVSPDDHHVKDMPALHRCEVRLCHGGRSRSESVLAGLRDLQKIAQPQDWVLVHDAVRPCVSIADLTHLAKCVVDAGYGGILAEKVVDTLKRCDGQQRVVETVSRDSLWRAQTPQMFRLAHLHDALAEALECGRVITDESSVMEGCGQPVQLVAGAPSNLKITVPEDLETASLFLAAGGND